MYASNPKLAHEMKAVLHKGLNAANLDIIEDGLFSEPPSRELRRRFAEGISDIAETASRQLMGWMPFAPFPWGMPKLLVVGGEKDQFMPAADVRLTAIYYGARSRDRAERRARDHAGPELARRRSADRRLAREDIQRLSRAAQAR